MSSPAVFVTDGQLRSALAVVRSLGRRGIAVTCGESTKAATSFFSKYCSTSVRYPSPDRNPEEFVEFLRSYLATHDVDVVLPVGHHSTQLVNEHRADLAEYVSVPVPGNPVFERALNKRSTFEVAARTSVPTPETLVPDSREEATAAAAEIGFPLVVKSPTGAGSRGVRFVDSRSELQRALDDLCEFGQLPLIQERIPLDGDGIGSAFLVDGSGKTRASFAYRRLREYPPSGGPSTLRESIDGRNVREWGRELLEALDWEGVAMVEFKVDPRDDTPKLMEVNPRFWGSLHLPYHAGVDFPWLLWKMARDEPIPTVEEYRRIQCRYMLPGDLLYLASERDRSAVRSFLPLIDEDLYYDVLSRDDPGATVGRLAAMARYAVSPSMWRKVVFRGSESEQ